MAARFKTDQWKFFLRHFPKLLEAVFNMAVFSSFMAMGLALWREQPDARLNEFEKTVRTTIVSIGLGLIVLLLLVVFRAVPSSTWDRVSEATPKRALWALLGLAGIAICLLSGALIDNWRKKKAAPATIAEAQQPQHLRMFGLLWDDNQNPLCPADQIPLSFFMRHASQHFDILQCARCGNRFQIRHDLMGNLQLANAKQMIRDGFGLV
jgi:hypothetical protein